MRFDQGARVHALLRRKSHLMVLLVCMQYVWRRICSSPRRIRSIYYAMSLSRSLDTTTGACISEWRKGSTAVRTRSRAFRLSLGKKKQQDGTAVPPALVSLTFMTRRRSMGGNHSYLRASCDHSTTMPRGFVRLAKPTSNSPHYKFDATRL